MRGLETFSDYTADPNCILLARKSIIEWVEKEETLILNYTFDQTRNRENCFAADKLHSMNDNDSPLLTSNAFCAARLWLIKRNANNWTFLLNQLTK